jgi:hypothetical protein
VDFEGPRVPEGRVVQLYILIAVDLTTVNKTISLGYKRAGTTYWLKREAAGAAAYGLHLDRPLILVEGESPVARVESATEGDSLVFLARGVYL